MKKKYLAPEIFILQINTGNLMAGSNHEQAWGDAKQRVGYTEDMSWQTASDTYGSQSYSPWED